MQILFLAGGNSNRVKPVGDKVLLKFCGETLFEKQIRNLSNLNPRKIVVAGNSANLEKIKKIAAAKFGEIRFEFFAQKNYEKGFADAILESEKFLNLNDPLLIVNSNDFVENKFWENLDGEIEKSAAEILICGKIVENYFPGGYLKLQKNRIEKIVEKPKPGTEPSNLIAVLIHFFKNPQRIFDAINSTKNAADGFYEAALQKLFDEKVPNRVFEFKEFWRAIKYPWDVLQLSQHFLKSLNKNFIHPSAKIAKTAVLKGKYFIGENCEIADGAVLSGWNYVSANCKIGNSILVRDSEFGENCVAGFGTEIARSKIEKNCWFHQNFVGDSIFCKNVSLGAGARTANLRLDEREIFVEIKNQKVATNLKKFGCAIGKNSRVGVNSTIFPGILIGENNFIGAGICVEKNLEN